jgi:hypothetical protein
MCPTMAPSTGCRRRGHGRFELGVPVRRFTSGRDSGNDLATEGPRHRNCDVYLDDLRWDRPDLIRTPASAGRPSQS